MVPAVATGGNDGKVYFGSKMPIWVFEPGMSTRHEVKGREDCSGMTGLSGVE